MRILIVEDEQGIADFLKQGLEEEGYAVDLASDGLSGEQMALSGEYDLLLLDWMVPEKSGLEICREFRKTDSMTPIIFLTAKDALEETISGLRAGANDYIKKPFHFEELLERIKVSLRPHHSENSAPLTLGSIRLNPETYEVFRSGEEIQLTQMEFALLRFLIENKGKVCERRQILEEVWDIHFEYNTGVIDVHINALRKKLNLTDSQDYIRTVRGVGYSAREL